MDTVHDPAPEAPFRVLSVAPDGKTATGPGVVDMKGGLVVAIHALEALAEVGLDASFGFILNSDEETGSFCSDRALRAEASRPEYAAALALEPANGPTGLVTSRGGSGQCMIEARGKAAHVGRDFASGRSATDLLARAVLAVHGLTNTVAGSIVNVSTLWCDQPPNQVADHAAAWGNLRYATSEAGDALARGLAAALAALSPTDLTLHLSLIRPAKPALPETLALAETVRATAAMLGQSITYTSTAGVCDGNNLQAGGRAASGPIGAGLAGPASDMGGGRPARPGFRTGPPPTTPPPPPPPHPPPPGPAPPR
ncbi:MAG: M20/M25/M40 family metallo-hydrolase, partial [Phycisphaerales bacterium]|nr:M20/M25/M40 family metallo-hydrolase [Phycisphaerales bacterium]